MALDDRLRCAWPAHAVDGGRAGVAQAERQTALDLLKRLPILEGIAPYQRAWLAKDLIAGVSLAALAIPGVMGYAKLAGMPVVTGLYTLLIPAVLFAVFGSSRHLVVGADSATAVMLYSGIVGLQISGLRAESPQWVALAGMVALLAAGVLFVARIARLGFLADFLSQTVLVGFLTGVGIQVALSQLNAMLGIQPDGHGDADFGQALLTFGDTLQRIDQASGVTVLVSLSVIVVLVVFRHWVKQVPTGLVVVVGAIVASYVLDLNAHGVAILGPVPRGLPRVELPAGVGFEEMRELLPAAASICLVILAQSAATSRAYAARYRERHDEGVDLVGLGLANVGAGLTGSFVVNGSPTKTEMLEEADGRTQVAQIVCAVVVALVLLFLTGPLRYLPTAALATVIFFVGLMLVDVRGMRDIFSARHDEFVVALVTAVTVVLAGVREGIVLAVVLSIVVHVQHSYRPVNVVLGFDAQHHLVLQPPTPGTETRPGLIIYRFGTGIFFANASHLLEEALALISVPTPPRWFVLDAAMVDDIDYSGDKMLHDLAQQCSERGVTLAIISRSEPVRAQLERSGMIATIGREHFFETSGEALDAFVALVDR